MPASFSALCDFDRGFAERGERLVGVDEAGRGPLAGPVSAAAVILDFSAEKLAPLAEVNDSKLLDALTRERLDAAIREGAVAFAVASAEVEEIDRINIREATHLAMRRAVQQVARPGDFVLVDGRPVPDLHSRCQAVVDGDALSLSVAAAGILAKVARDRIMLDSHAIWPDYGFNQHKGYPTRLHRLALEVLGPCPLHRRSFAPVAENLEPRRVHLSFRKLACQVRSVREAAEWEGVVFQVLRELPALSLSEGQLLTLMLKEAGVELALSGKALRDELNPLRAIVGLLRPTPTRLAPPC